MARCWVYFFVCLIHFVSILLLLHFQDEIINERILQKQSISSYYSDIQTKWMIICIVVNGSILLFSKLKAQYITIQQMSTFVMIIIAIIAYSNNIFNIRLNIKSYYVIFILFPSIITCRIWIDFEQIKIDNKMFEYDGNKDIDWNENKHYIIFYKLLTLLYNIIMNIYCFVFTDKPFNIAYISAFTILGTVGIIPYYLLPSVKYDVFHRKTEIVLTYSIVCTLILGLLLFRCFQHPVFSIISDLSFNLCILFMFGAETVSTVYLPYIKKQKFKSICNNKQEPLLWSDYITRNINNYNQFKLFLLDTFCVENLLFIIDIMQYKNKMIQIINNNNIIDYIDYGYILQFNSGGDILPTSPIVNDLQIIYNETDLKMIMNTMYHDIIAFYHKYIALNSRSIKAKFISQKQLIIIRQKIRNGFISDDEYMKGITNMLIIFDKALFEVHGLLQMLYTQYQFNSNQ